MLAPEPAKTAARRQRRLDRLGNDAACIICGEADPTVLDTAQGHHVATRINEPDLTVVLCANCHRRETEHHAAAGIPTQYEQEPTQLDRLSAILMGIADFLLDVGQLLLEWARWIDDFHRNLTSQGIALETVLPQWKPQLIMRSL